MGDFFNPFGGEIFSPVKPGGSSEKIRYKIEKEIENNDILYKLTQTINDGATESVGEAITLKPATETTLGLVKVGKNISIDENGVISVNNIPTNPTADPSNIESISIVDGELWVNYTDGTSKSLGSVVGPKGEQGVKGDKGDNGSQGLQGERGEKGEKGDKGDGFAISKIYKNINDMINDTDSSLKNGQMLGVISTESGVFDAEVYIKNSNEVASGKNLNGFTYFTNLSNASVIQGPKGEKGEVGNKGENGLTPDITITDIAATALDNHTGKKVNISIGTDSKSFSIYNGTDGTDGISVKTAKIDAQGHLIIELSDGNKIDCGSIGGGVGGSVIILGCYETAPMGTVNDVYYNTTNKLLYEMKTNNDWGNGFSPTESVLYVSLNDNKIYTQTSRGWGVFGIGDVELQNKPKNAIKKDSNGALFVRDLSSEVNAINYTTKMNRYKDVGYYFATSDNKLSTTVKKETDIFSLLNKRESNNISILEDEGSIILQKGIPYRIEFNLACQEKVNFYICDYNETDPIKNHYGSEGLSGVCNAVAIVMPEDEGLRLKFVSTDDISLYDNNCYISINALDRFQIDPVDYIDKNLGMSDTPVGTIYEMPATNIVPNGYLPLDGREIKVGKYPYLEQYFKDAFGKINYYGGDGINNYLLPISPMNTTKYENPLSNGANCDASSEWQQSSEYGVEKAFNNIQGDCWVSAPGQIGDTTWISINYHKSTPISFIELNNRNGYPRYFPEIVILEGLSDDSNWVSLETISTGQLGANETKIYNLSNVYSYSAYRLKMTITYGENGYYYTQIGEWTNGLSYSSNIIKVSPTHYMNLNVDISTIDSMVGLQDIPVGTTLDILSTNFVPNGYLPLDGRTIQIGEYPDLEEYLIDAFGKVNYYGGDGTNNYLLPDETQERIYEIHMTGNNSPSPYVATAKTSYPNGTVDPWMAFDDNINSAWNTDDNQTLPTWLAIDYGKPTLINKIILYPRQDHGFYNRQPKEFVLQGSTNGTNWIDLQKFNNPYPISTNPDSFILDSAFSYRYYRIYVITNKIGTAVVGFSWNNALVSATKMIKAFKSYYTNIVSPKEINITKNYNIQFNSITSVKQISEIIPVSGITANDKLSITYSLKNANLEEFCETKIFSIKDVSNGEKLLLPIDIISDNIVESAMLIGMIKNDNLIFDRAVSKTDLSNPLFTIKSVDIIKTISGNSN